MAVVIRAGGIQVELQKASSNQLFSFCVIEYIFFVFH